MLLLLYAMTFGRSIEPTTRSQRGLQTSTSICLAYASGYDDCYELSVVVRCQVTRNLPRAASHNANNVVMFKERNIKKGPNNRGRLQIF